MFRPKPAIDWQICDDDRKWEEWRTTAPLATVSHPVRRAAWPRRRMGWVCAALLAMLLPLMFAGYRTLRQADETMARVEQEIAAVAEEQAGPHTAENANTTPSTDVRLVRGSVHGDSLEARRIEVRGDYAMVEVWAHTSNLPWLPVPYRQTRFYHATAQGWQPAEPPDAFYQPLDTFQAGRFTFVYGPRDADAVWAAAAQVEALDAALRAELGLLPTDEALTIKVVGDSRLTSDPAKLTRMDNDATLYTPSPALLSLPVEITEGEALLQLVAGGLIHADLSAALGDAAQVCAWQNMIDGLRLWLLGEHSELPSQALNNALAFFHRGQGRGVLPGLAWLTPDQRACSSGPYERMSTGGLIYDGAAIAFVDYAVAAYGRERLPTLIAGMKRYSAWETLIPAAFGVSAAEFEAGWQASLQESK